MKKTKILVTGSGGFILGNYTRRLIHLTMKFPEKYNYVVSSLDNVSSKSLSAIINNKNHSFHIADVMNKHILDIIFKFERPDVVIHGVSMHENNAGSISARKYNDTGALNVADACEKYNVKKLITLNHNSDELIKHSMSNNRKLINIIMPDVFGPRQSNNNIIPMSIFNALNNNTISVVDDMRPLVHVFDVCSAISTVTNKELNNTDSSNNVTYKICNSKSISMSLLINKIYKLVGTDVNLITSSKKGSITYTDLDDSFIDISEKTDWSPVFTKNFDRSLKDTVDWYIKNRWFFKSLESKFNATEI